MASGIPSSRAQISATVAALSSCRRKFCRPLIARSAKRRTASYCESTATGSCAASRVGSASGGTRQLSSPGTLSGARLVASTVTSEHDARSAAATSAQPSRRCSQLSSTSSMFFSLNRSAIPTNGSPRIFRDHRGAADGRRDQCGVREADEVDPPDAVGVTLGDLGRDLLREACLARAARSGERDQAIVVEESDDGDDVVEASDERRQRHRQVVRHRVERPQRRELGGEVGMGELPDVLGTGEVLQAMHPEIDERHVVAEVVDHQVACRRRDHHLAAVRDRAQPCGANHRLTRVVAVVAETRFAGVHRHAHPQWTRGRPGFLEEGTLRIERGEHRVGRPREGGHHAVALALLEWPHAVVRGDRRIEEVVVACDGVGHRRRLQLPHLRRALDVGQEEGDRPRRQREGSR